MIWRNIGVVRMCPLKGSCDALLTGICTTQDVDFLFRHMNNARYIRELDFARFLFYDLSGLYHQITKMKGIALQGASTIRYRRTIPIFSIYKIDTKVSLVQPELTPS
jgi:acyl-CoA thioesterase FadM